MTISLLNLMGLVVIIRGQNQFFVGSVNQNFQIVIGKVFLKSLHQRFC